MIVAIYAGVLACIFIVLSFMVTAQRAKSKTFSGTATADDSLMAYIRAHGNFAEYAPIMMVLLVILELQQVAPTILHGFGAIYVLARCAHAFALISTASQKADPSQPPKNMAIRAFGVFGNHFCIAGAGVLCIYHALQVM